MKILHVVPLIQASTGGPAVSVTRLASEQAKMGHEVTLACLDYPHLGPQVAALGVRVVSLKGNVFAVRGRGWSPEFRRVLMEEARKADVVHNHGLWMWPNAYAREAAVAAGKPLIISPRGMLEAWSLNRSKLRKVVAWWLFERKNLQSAVLFHATAESEKRSIEKALSHGLTRIDTDSFSGGDPAGKSNSSEKAKKAAVVVAPNGVDLPDLGRRPGREVLEEKFPELRSRRWVVFMSRLHPKKGVDVLLRAWARQKDVTCDMWRVTSGETKTARQNVEHTAYGIRHTEGEGRSAYASGAANNYGVTRAEDNLRHTNLKLKTAPHRGAVLVLAGSDLIGYGKEIKRMIKELGLVDSVVMTGEVAGEAKDCLLGNAEVFVLPSYSENFGIVVAEAMAWGRPVIATTGTPWKEVAEVGAGWWVKPEEEPLAKALEEAMGKGPEALDAMGAKGRALVERSYGWAAPAAKLVRAYEEVFATAE